MSQHPDKKCNTNNDEKRYKSEFVRMFMDMVIGGRRRRERLKNRWLDATKNDIIAGVIVKYVSRGLRHG